MADFLADMPDQERVRLGFLLACGLVGGAAIGNWAYQHLFVEGLTDKERRPIVFGLGSIVLVYGVAKLLDADNRWWLTVGGMAEEAERRLAAQTAEQGTSP